MRGGWDLLNTFLFYKNGLYNTSIIIVHKSDFPIRPIILRFIELMVDPFPFFLYF
jgi:hypothetical protein